MPDQAFIYGFGIGIVLTLLVVLRWPAFRAKLLNLPIRKDARK